MYISLIKVPCVESLTEAVNAHPSQKQLQRLTQVGIGGGQHPGTMAATDLCQYKRRQAPGNRPSGRSRSV